MVEVAGKGDSSSKSILVNAHVTIQFIPAEFWQTQSHTLLNFTSKPYLLLNFTRTSQHWSLSLSYCAPLMSRVNTQSKENYSLEDLLRLLHQPLDKELKWLLVCGKRLSKAKGKCSVQLQWLPRPVADLLWYRCVPWQPKCPSTQIHAIQLVYRSQFSHLPWPYRYVVMICKMEKCAKGKLLEFCTINFTTAICMYFFFYVL